MLETLGQGLPNLGGMGNLVPRQSQHGHAGQLRDYGDYGEYGQAESEHGYAMHGYSGHRQSLKKTIPKIVIDNSRDTINIEFRVNNFQRVQRITTNNGLTIPGVGR